MADFVKRHPNSPAGFFACEAAGLRWLSAADGGVRCARVIASDEDSLTLERLRSVRPTRERAHEFGRRLGGVPHWTPWVPANGRRDFRKH
jgi:fructosamine-3-kinase